MLDESAQRASTYEALVHHLEYTDMPGWLWSGKLEPGFMQNIPIVKTDGTSQMCIYVTLQQSKASAAVFVF